MDTHAPAADVGHPDWTEPLALGLVAFGVWCFVEARTRRSDV